MKKLLFFLPAVFFYLLIFLGSSNGLGIHVPGRVLDKFGHLFEFGFLAFLLSFGFFHVLTFSLRGKVITTLAFGLTLGVLDEFHQYYVPGRNADIRDLFADALGTVCGIFIYWYLAKMRARAKSG